jgi:GNAT superfamily N-acetyltransferase
MAKFMESHRQRAGIPDAPRSPLRWLPNWRPGRNRLPARRPRPAAGGNTVVLRDGSQVVIRQVQRADAPLLVDGFARLSARSRQMRFLTEKKKLSAAELRYFTEVDHHDHEALGALSHTDGRGVGIARYVRDAEDPQAAEIAVTIVDDWQGRGLGTKLLAQLSDRARQEGVHRFTALVSSIAVPAPWSTRSCWRLRRRAATTGLLRCRADMPAHLRSSTASGSARQSTARTHGLHLGDIKPDRKAGATPARRPRRVAWR